jgi:hypothetical protein
VALAGLGLVVTLPIVAHMFLHDDWILGAIGLVPLVAACVGYVFSRRGQSTGAVCTLLALGVALTLGLLAFGAVRVDRFQQSARFARLIAGSTPRGQQPTIASFDYFRPSLVFYTDRTIEQLETPEEVQSFFAAHPGTAFVFTTDERFEQLGAALPAEVSVLDARPRFLGRGNILLLGRAPHWSAAAARSADRSNAQRH